VCLWLQVYTSDLRSQFNSVQFMRGVAACAVTRAQRGDMSGDIVVARRHSGKNSTRLHRSATRRLLAVSANLIQPLASLASRIKFPGMTRKPSKRDVDLGGRRGTSSTDSGRSRCVAGPGGGAQLPVNVRPRAPVPLSHRRHHGTPDGGMPSGNLCSSRSRRTDCSSSYSSPASAPRPR